MNLMWRGITDNSGQGEAQSEPDLPRHVPACDVIPR